MLVYLDNSQFAWLEGLEDSLQAEFVSEWRALGCELALSLQILQEVHKRGDEESISKRIETLLSLAPLRGMPAGSAGVMVREVTDQVRQLLGTAVADPVAGGRAALFPHMSPTTLRETLAENSDDLSRFDVIGQAQAELQSKAHGLPPVKKGTRVDVVAMEEFIRTKQRELLAGLPRNIATEMVRELGDRAIDAVKATEGNLWRANLVRLGISQLGCLRDLNAEDYSKAAGFVEMAREYAADIAEGAGTDSSRVLELVNQLRPYDAPGYSLEMAVARARARHSPNPTASDQVDEEHVTFAPYVDLLFVDKRTKAYLEQELRRQDGRIAYDPSLKLVRARDMDDVLDAIRSAGRGN